MTEHLLPSGHLLQLRYSIQSVISQEMAGILYLAYDRKLDQEVCIKELFIFGNSQRGRDMNVQSQSDSILSFHEITQGFVQKAKQLAKFQHPNIVRVFDVFQENSTAYLVMEYANGQTLRQKIIEAGVMKEQQAISCITQLLDALQAIHTKDMLHLNINPDNILLTSEGKVVLGDFGFGRELMEGKVQYQKVLLTPGYTAPEQHSDGARLGVFSDIYSLGATMYYMVTGKNPLSAMERGLAELIPPQKIIPKISAQLSNVIMLSMDLNSGYRFQNTSEIKGAMNSLLVNSTRSYQTNPNVVTPETKDSNQVPFPKGNNVGYEPKKSISKLALVFILYGISLIIGFTVMLIESSNMQEEAAAETNLWSEESTTEEIAIDSTVAEEIIIDESTEGIEEMESDDFLCNNGNTVSANYVNDGDCDCDDCSDEN